MPKLLNLIVACSENRVIGRDRRLPWHIPEDLMFFHEQTARQTCILGRVGFETWPRATMDGRQPVVLTSRSLAELQFARREKRMGREQGRKVSTNSGAEATPIVVSSFAEALAVADRLPAEVYICGGQRIYEETLALTDRPLRLHLTLIHAEVTGDTFMPEWRHLAWRETARRESGDAQWRYTFLTLER